MIKSTILDGINKFFACAQEKLAAVTAASALIKNIDDIIFALSAILLVVSTFCETEILGAIGLLVMLAAFVKLVFIKGAKIEFSRADGALLIFFLVLIFATFNSTEVKFSLEGLSKYFIYIGYYFSIVPLFRKKRKNVLWIVLLLAAICSLEALYALLQSNTVMEGATWQDMSYINPEDAISRIYGSLKPYNPNLLAGYLVACFPCVVGVALLTVEKRHSKSFFIALINILIVFAAIFQTGCRGAYLALLGIVFGYMFISYRIAYYDFFAFKKIQNWWKNFLIMVTGVGVLALACMPKILNRLMSVFLLRGDSSTSFRMNVYQSSWHMFADNPLFGIGPGNHTFREVYGYYMMTGFDALGAYSVPLEIAVESGIVGFLAFFSFVGLLFWQSARYICQDQSIRGKIYVSICIVSVFGLMVHGLFDTVFFRPQIQFVFWTMVAVLNGVLSRKEAG